MSFAAAGSTFSVCISNPIVIQTDVFHSWVEGKTDMDSMDSLATRRKLERCPELFSIVQSQYKMFELLEVHIQRPRFFIDQCMFPLPLEMKRTLLEFYYNFDAEIAREILDRKMSSKGRRDLDEICELTGQPLQSIRRQFETFKRIQKRVEELPGDLLSNIQKKFLLSKSLSLKYAAFILLSKHRIETSKRKISISTTTVFETAEAMFIHLTLPLKSVEFDYNLAREIRELRLSGFGSNLDLVGAPFPLLVSTIVENALQLGSGLSQAKEIKDFFHDLNEYFVIPIQQSNLSKPQTEKVFEFVSELQSSCIAWSRLVSCIRIALLSVLNN